MMKLLLPNKRNLLGVVLLIALVLTGFILFIFLGGDLTNNDRGHESYSGTKISEIYADTLNLPLGYTLYLPFTVLSQFNKTGNLEFVFFEIFILLCYWYLLSCLFTYLYPHIRNKLNKQK